MLFSSITFIFYFLPIVIVIYFFILEKSRTLQNLFLTFSSLLFYAWGEPWFVIIMIGSIVYNWFFALVIDKYRNTKFIKKILFIMVFGNLSLLFYYKYLNFVLVNINLPTTNIILPIGISFFTFQAMSYVLDVYLGRGELQKNVFNVGLYVSFFPQLIAGPIVRYETVAYEIKNRIETYQDFNEGVKRFIIGLGKKVILANNLAIVADAAFNLITKNNSNSLSLSFAWLGALAYTLQIYFDFSGYSDMAIGLGKMFGFHFLENFNYPYISKSTTDFWRRWHISLSSWFRDYIYIPLGGSKVSSHKRLFLNLFIVWILTGIWHGANWTFIAWGIYFYILIVIERIMNINSHLGTASRIYTLFSVVIGWVLFRSQNINFAIQYYKSMFDFNFIFDYKFIMYISEYGLFLVLGILFSTNLINRISSRFDNRFKYYLSTLSLILIFLISIMYLVKGSYNPFIYFNF